MAKQKTNTSSAPKFEWVPFEQLVFLENNPRTRTAEGLQKMAARIQADPDFYSLRPTLVNFTEGEYRVYAGDLRAHAAHDICGWELVPCNVERNVPQDLVLSRALADNAHFEDWDGAKLSLWEFEPDELEDFGVKWEMEDGEDDQSFIQGINQMSENDLQPPENLPNFDPVGIAADLWRVVFIFDNKSEAERFLQERPEFEVKKYTTAWQVDLSTLSI